MSFSLSHVWLITRRELRDLRRDKGAWRAMFLQPLLIAAALSPVIFAVDSGREERSTRRYTAVVEGDADLASGVADHLTGAGMRVLAGTDGTLAVAGEDAHVAVLVERAENDSPARIIIEQRVASEPSRRAAAIALRAAEDFRIELVQSALTKRGADADAARPFGISVEDATSASPQAARLTVAAALPSIIAIQLFSLVSLAQQRLGSAKDRRVFEPMLVLPVSRIAILLGAAVASVVLAFSSSGVVLVPLAGLLIAGVGTLTSSLAAPLSVMAALAVEVALLSSLFVAAGLYIGARTASGANSTTISAVLQTALIVVLSASVFVAEADVSVSLAAVPVIGALLVAREGAAEGLVLTHVVVAAAAHLGIVAVLLRAGAARLGERRSVLRAT